MAGNEDESARGTRAVSSEIFRYKNNRKRSKSQTDYADSYLEKGLTDFNHRWQTAEKRSTGSSLSDFRIFRMLGEGTYGKVMLVYHNENKAYYAMKMIDKEMIVKRKQVPHTMNEKRILQCINFTFVLNLIFAFQDNVSLFLVMPVVSGGELFMHLQRVKKFSEIVAKFYSAQVLLALEYLHYLGIIYRDLKPENLLLDCEGYIKITDFGFAKVVAGRTYTFCGTPEYIAPEIIKSTGYSHASDWWSFGILMYELCAGYAPFRHDEPIKLYELIVDGKYVCPGTFGSELRAALSCVLQVDTTKRFGNLKNGARDIKNLKWFSNLNWMEIYEKKHPSPYTPACKTPQDIARSTKNVPIIPTAENDEYIDFFQDF